MKKDYSIKKYSLKFHDKYTERLYKNFVLSHTIWYCRFAWGLVIFLGSSFGLLDRLIFEADAKTVLMVRFIFIFLSAAILALTFIPKFKYFMDWNSCLFILIIGIFCTFLTAMSDPSAFSPYFTGLLLAFTGIFSTAGLGFKYSLLGIFANLIIFEIVIGFLYPVPFILLVMYNFFLFTALVIFSYIGYLIEKISRYNFIASSQLNDSLSEVKKLSGLLPICSSCKKIRDDKGYWKQIELYIRDHSEAEFSHGMCPDCMEKAYGDQDWYKTRRKRSGSI